MGKGDIFCHLTTTLCEKMSVLASGIEKLISIIRIVIKLPVLAGVLLVSVRFSIVFIKITKCQPKQTAVYFDGMCPETSLRCFILLAY